MQLREQQVPAVQVNTPSRNHASTASKDAVIAALQKRIRVQEQRIREQAADIERLKQQVEVAYGQVAVQANRKNERT